MKREDRLSAGLTPQKVSEVYAILKAQQEKGKRRRQEEDEKLRMATEIKR